MKSRPVLAARRRGVVTLTSPWPGWTRIAEDACRRFQRGSSFADVGRWLAAVTKKRQPGAALPRRLRRSEGE